MKIKLTMGNNFWLWLIRFSYRRLFIVTKHPPDGVPTIRDWQALCNGYEPRKKRLQDWTGCETDGHYLCQECCHKAVDVSGNNSPQSLS